MKRYEKHGMGILDSKVPVIIRVDGKSFSKLTRGLDKPWDSTFIECMQETARYLAENIQGCKLAYVQSDEISLLLTDFETEDTQGWFGYKVQKMASVSAALASTAFTTSFFNYFEEYQKEVLSKKLLPVFDSRCFSVKDHDVSNYFTWRQKDAIRNSVQMLARAYFSHKQCNNKSCEELKEMLRGINVHWELEDSYCRRGGCVVKVKEDAQVSYTDKRTGEENTIEVTRNVWKVDTDIPLFWEDRNYTEQYIVR